MNQPTKEQQETIDGYAQRVSALNKKLMEAEAESAGRLTALNEKAEEVRREWQRAEAAEAERDQMREALKAIPLSDFGLGDHPDDCAMYENPNEKGDIDPEKCDCWIGRVRKAIG